MKPSGKGRDEVSVSTTTHRRTTDARPAVAGVDVSPNDGDWDAQEDQGTSEEAARKQKG